MLNYPRSIQRISDPTCFDAPSFLKTVTSRPGVYQMYDAHKKMIYIGKAKNLKARLLSYFLSTQQPIKTQRLVQKIQQIEVIITPSDYDAYVLESELIKKHHPPYNILFRDDKSYPYIYVSEHPFPRLSFYRGHKKNRGRYFGPYPNSLAVKKTLRLLQKLFQLRDCNDIFFKNRHRPCLQYQMKRCSAPCVDFIDSEAYSEKIEKAFLFLENKNDDLLKKLSEEMNVATQEFRYEQAAQIRDQIAHLRQIQHQQTMTQDSLDTDIIALIRCEEYFCIQILFIRNHQMIGERKFFPTTSELDDHTLDAFVSYYYFGEARPTSNPKQIITNTPISKALIKNLEILFAHKIALTQAPKQERRQWLEMAEENGKQALLTKIKSKSNIEKRFFSLEQSLKNISNLKAPASLQRIECFDISHTMGTSTMASCVVFDRQGPCKKDYRRYSIKGIQPGDDYAAMEMALLKRFSSHTKKPLPELILIDGGKGQLRKTIDVMSSLKLNPIIPIGMAKGPTRKSGLEQLFLNPNGLKLELDEHDPGFHLLQQIRNEAHRFAITGHRQARRKSHASALEKIEGIGPRRRKILLERFGGLQEIMKASRDELAHTPGIGKQTAQKIYDTLHDL